MTALALQSRVPLTTRLPTAIVAWRNGRAVTIGEMLADAQRLRLADAPAILNLCSDRYAFLVGFVACLMQGRPCLLPGDRSGARIAELLRADPGIGLLVEDGAAVPPEAAGRPTAAARLLVGGAAEPVAGLLPAPDQVTTIAFTSGSTGAPVAHARSWESQARQIDAVAARFGLAGEAPATLVATVPFGHMYGFETTILLPLRAEVAVHSGTPLYPDDIRRALDSVPGPRVLVTSPVHLRALSGGAALPPLARVISATAPLGADLAAAVEARHATRVEEIYGCTEAGSVASRRTVAGDDWLPFDGIAVEPGGPAGSGAFQARLPATALPVPLADLLAIGDDGCFRLLGRVQDVIKVGGKRASLGALTSALVAVDGVEDGAFVMPEADAHGGATRPVALVVAPRLTPKLVLDGLRRRIDPAFVPRRVVMVPALPRDALGKLPRAAVAALLAAATADEATVTITFAPDHPALPGHFPGRPLMPGVLLLDAVAERARAAFGLGPLAGVAQAKFMGVVPPGAVTTVRLRRRDAARVGFEMRLHGEVISVGELRFAEPLP